MMFSKVKVTENRGSTINIVRIYTINFLLIVSMILRGCTPGRSGPIIESDFENISRIKKVGLYVKVEKGFAVRLQYVSNADISFFSSLMSATLAGGIIGAGLAVMGEFSPDKQATRKLKPNAAQMESAEAIGQTNMDKLRFTTIFPSVVLVQSPSLNKARENGIDAIFYFTIRRWGLRPPLGSKYDVHYARDKALAQLELNVNLMLVSCATGKVLWKFNELYIDRQSYTLGDFKSQKGLLVDRLKYALQSVSDLTVNELSIKR
jgi:hypothetical protein